MNKKLVNKTTNKNNWRNWNNRFQWTRTKFRL